MRKGVTADSPITAPVLRAGEILSSLHPFVASQDLTPQTRSDYNKPFLIRPQAGFGKTDVEISIDGWQLGKVTDKSDNTAVLDSVIKAVKEVTTLTKGVSKAEGCPKAGLYKLEYSKGNLQLEPLLIYYKEENKR